MGRTLLKKLFSVKNIYRFDNNEIIVYKEICILGFKLYKKVKNSQYERYLLEITRPFVMSDILKDLGYLTGRESIYEIFESNKKQDKLLVENLYKNLDNEAKNNLDKIINRNAKVVKYTRDLLKYPKAKIILTKEEFEELEKINQFENEVKAYDNYFKWKDYLLPVNSFEASVFLYKHGIDVLRNKDKVTGIIIDAGANIGDSAIVFSRNFPNNKIISFEPIKENYQLCKKTVELNKCDNVFIENMGLGDEIKNSYIETMGRLNSASKVTDSGTEKIKITTIDSYVKENNIEVGLIKTDVEGFEPNLLRGAQETIRTQAPVLLISIYHNCDDFCRLKTMIEEIMKNSKYKYRYDFFQPVYNSVISETLLICERA